MDRVKGSLCRLKNRVVLRAASRFDEELARVDSWTEDQLAELNWRRRRELVAHCAKHVPYYRRKFASIGFEPGDLKRPEDFAKLPILEKREIREHEHELVSDSCNVRKLPASTTGGSTGNPLRTYNDPSVPISAISWRMLRWWGVAPWMNAGYVYRSIPKGWRRQLGAAALFPTRRTYLSALDMSRDNMRQFCDELNSIRAQYLIGYVGAIDALGQFVESDRIVIPSLKAIWTTAAPLLQGKRAFLQRVFSCPTYTQYGSCEFYFLAAECERQAGLHIASDVRHVEIVDSGVNDNLEGEGFGDIIASDLTNYAFPLLRYRVGDRGRLLAQSCKCQRPYPLLDYVRGRVSDNILLNDGTCIPGEFWTTIFDDYVDRIRSFQVHQYDDRSVVVRFEPIGGPHQDMIAAVASTLEKKIRGRADLRFSAEPVSPHDGGKSRFVTSDMSRRQ